MEQIEDKRAPGDDVNNFSITDDKLVVMVDIDKVVMPAFRIRPTDAQNAQVQSWIQEFRRGEYGANTNYMSFASLHLSSTSTAVL